MRSPLRDRFARTIAAFGLALAALLPAASARAAAPLVLRVGETQDLDSLNPFMTALEIGYEVFTLNYDLLVNFGQNNEAVPGFADTWTQSADGLSWTFHIRSGMKWSDGQPATSEDVRYTYQLELDGTKDGGSVGLGYLDPYLKDSFVTAVTAPDPSTVVITSSRPTSKLTSAYIPILPAHIWKNVKPANVSDFKNNPTNVGTGPYQVVEWKASQYVKLQRNPNYWGTPGAEDQIVIQFYPDAPDTMVAAFKNNELDYIHNPSAGQFNQLKTLPKTVALATESNGFTQINFNTYDKDIPSGGASTKALRDPAFRTALGYAVDKSTLIQKVLLGYGSPGTTQVPPWQRKWHVDPTDIRQFNIATANTMLDAAGYPRGSDGTRVDKEGKPINLRLYFPSDNPDYAKDAQFVQDWYGQAGVKVTAQGLDSGTLGTLEYLDGSKAAKGQLKYDMVIWGWTGDPDPNALLTILETSSIGNTSDSQWSNTQYDGLFDQQNQAATDADRHALMAQMQQLFYDQAPYEILYYDNNLDAYHTDKFANWQNQPADGGAPFFLDGSLAYTVLTDATKATPVPSAAPSVATSPVAGSSTGPVASPTPAPVATDTSGSGSSLGLILAVVAIAALLVVVLLMTRRRRAAAAEDDE
jgi:peptide/nickel transport system substrate-binding protein